MTTTADLSVPPMPYVVATWLGYPLEHIVEGLQRGSIAPPEGAPPGWLPPGAEAFAPADGAPDAPGDVASTEGDAPADAGAPDDDPGAAPPADVRAAYFSLANTVDASLDEATFDALWRSSGDDDATRASHIGGLLWRTVGGDPAPGGDADALADAIADRRTRGTLVALAEAGSAALAERARGDPAVLSALATLDGFAFTDVTNGATPGLTRFDPTTGEANVSDAWIDDRAKFVAWRDALRDDPGAASEAGTAWRFVDRTLGDVATVTVGDAAASNQVVFARDGGDAVTGGSGVDRVHGGTGDDQLDGGAGDDLVEGARGDDALTGGDGDDSLDGGSGRDRLAGGRGDDRLAGGTGHDVYAFAPGEGTDVIVDADGDGEIVVDGRVLSGDDAGVSFATESDGTGGTTLVVRPTGIAGTAPGEIRVRDWHEGALGIHLAPAAGSAESAATPAADSLGALLKPRVASAAAELKPLVTSGELSASDARENGNESGPGAIDLATTALHGAVRAVDRAEDRGYALDVADWARALRGAPGFGAQSAIESPPDLDAGAVTAADIAGALADAAGDLDDGDAAFEAVRLPWATAQEVPGGLEPPGVPSRRGG